MSRLSSSQLPESIIEYIRSRPRVSLCCLRAAQGEPCDVRSRVRSVAVRSSSSEEACVLQGSSGKRRVQCEEILLCFEIFASGRLDGLLHFRTDEREEELPG